MIKTKWCHFEISHNMLVLHSHTNPNKIKKFSSDTTLEFAWVNQIIIINLQCYWKRFQCCFSKNSCFTSIKKMQYTPFRSFFHSFAELWELVLVTRKGSRKTEENIKTVELTFVDIWDNSSWLHCFTRQIQFLNNIQNNGIRMNMLNELLTKHHV